MPLQTIWVLRITLEESRMNTIKTWVRTHKPHTAGIATAVIVAIALIVATASGAFAPAKHKNSIKPTASASSDAGKAETPADVDMSVAANEGWTKDSTPVIVHVKTSDNAKKKDTVDFYHAVSAAEDNKASDSISLTPDKYNVEVISPLNSDGSVMAVYNTSDSKDRISVVSKSAITVKEPARKDAKASDAKDDSNAISTTDNRIDITLNKVPAEQVTDDMVKTIVDKTKTAVDNGDTTLKGDAGKEVLDKVETNAKANPNVSEATTEKAEENKTTANTSAETAKSTTAPSAGKSNTGEAKSSGSSNTSQPKNESSTNNGVSQTTQAPVVSHSNTSSGSSNKPAEKPKKWVPEQGHYEDVTEKVWVSNWVEEPVYETKQVMTGKKYIFAEDGYTTTSTAESITHARELMTNGYAGNFRVEPVYETQTVQTGTKKVDKGGYQTKVTGKKWVVDVPGHYE